MEKIPVYFMPGLAASAAIFERIKLPEEQFEVFYLEWVLPKETESLKDYSIRLSKNIKHKNPVLIGVSFGGILVQEISKIIIVRKTIIISSVKSNQEFPKRFKVAKATKIYKMVPTGLAQNVEFLAKFSFGKTISKRLKFYEKFLFIRDKSYLDWAIESVVLWDRTLPDNNVIHIHGDLDEVFPIKNINDCIVLKGGTHIMIINKYRWLNANLPNIILEA